MNFKHYIPILSILLVQSNFSLAQKNNNKPTDLEHAAMALDKIQEGTEALNPRCKSVEPPTNKNCSLLEANYSLMMNRLKKGNPNFFNAHPFNEQELNCIKASINLFGGHAYADCSINEQINGNKFSSNDLSSAEIACKKSSELSSANQLAFYSSVECLSEYVTGSKSAESKDIFSRSLFSMISIESGFIPNAVSSTGCIGIGQFNADTIQEVNNTEWANLTRYISESSNKNPGCKVIEKFGTKPVKISETKVPGKKTAYSMNKCDLISTREGNPLKNLLYTIAYQKYLRTGLFKHAANLPAKPGSANEALQKIQKSNVQKDKDFVEKFYEMISIWAHNTGLGGFKPSFGKFLQSANGAALIQKRDTHGILEMLRKPIGDWHENNHDQYVATSNNQSKRAHSIKYKVDSKKTEHHTLKKLNGKVDRPTETADFWRKIQTKVNDINQYAGAREGEVKCGIVY